MTNYRMLLRLFNCDVTVNIKCIDGRLKGKKGTVHMTRDFKPMICFDGVCKDFKSTIEGLNNRYIIIGVVSNKKANKGL